MILISSVYQDVQDALLKEANGDIPISIYNRLSKLAELKLLDWITGDIAGRKPPEPYLTQKDKDWASPFITKFPTHIEGGEITRPVNYYGFENLYVLGAALQTVDCEDEEPVVIDNGNTPIELLDGGQFTERQRTYIDELKPNYKNPIAKMVGTKIEFFPKDLGSITLEYYRYPKFGEVKSILDTQYNEEVPDEATSINYEWDEKARPALIWFIVDMFSNRISNQAVKQFNAATGKTAHGE
jgi:hypothetical protein